MDAETEETCPTNEKIAIDMISLWLEREHHIRSFAKRRAIDDPIDPQHQKRQKNDGIIPLLSKFAIL